MTVQQPWATVAKKVTSLLRAACVATLVTAASAQALGDDNAPQSSIAWAPQQDEPFGSPVLDATTDSGSPANAVPVPVLPVIEGPTNEIAFRATDATVFATPPMITTPMGTPLFAPPPSQLEPLTWAPLSHGDGQVFASTLLYTQEQQPTIQRPREVLLVARQQDVAPPPIEPSSPSDIEAPAPLQDQTTAAPNPSTYGKEPESIDRQTTRWFLRTQSPLLRPGQWQFDAGIAYSQFQYDYPAIDSPTNVARVDLRRRTILCPLAVRYGVTENLQCFANVPVGYRNTELGTAPISTPTPFDSSNAYGGVGDIYVGTNYRLVKGDYEIPDIIWTITGGLPTGEKSVLTDVFQGGLGTGFASLGTSFLVIHSYDPIILYWGGGWQYYFQGDLQGTPVQLGNVALYQLGTGFAVNDRVTISTAFLGGYVQQTKINGANLPDSQQEPMRMRFAVTAFRNRHIVEPFSEIGMTFTTPNARVGVVWTF